ncbi:MAG: alpha-amylase [Erysipelotrichaceae bacterium]|jgi:glycosidase|nr:alpha-amylase [Erysipelotrichaceae bacterium]
MRALSRVISEIEKQAKKHPYPINYAVPDIWDTNDIDEKRVLSDHQILVDPYAFYHSALKKIEAKAQADIDYQKPYYQSHKVKQQAGPGSWIKNSAVYSMMVRASGGWDHDRDGKIMVNNPEGFREVGTFLKAMVLLPWILEMGFDVLYLLPISKYSRANKKGELGSPYGVVNFYKIDEELSDPLCGNLGVDVQFKAFVEAAHILGIKVVIDIIPRTNSVNSELIAQHPDWFYWLDVKQEDNYTVPAVLDVPPVTSAKPQYAKQIYESPEVLEHIKKFRVNPKDQDPKKWERVLKLHSEHPEVLLGDLIRAEFGLCIAPAFSDCINDTQPAWSDVTYFRMYLDHPDGAKKYLKDYQDYAPYILFDVAKCSFNPGVVVNQPLWDSLSNIIPFFIKHFGIDGARIDMGHALPLDLVAELLAKAKQSDPNFCFIAEELDLKNDTLTKQKGYNVMIGNGFTAEPRVFEHELNDFAYQLSELAIPVFALGETHDTPRLAGRPGGRVLARMLSVLNEFLPNSVPFLNSGQEVFERQPMNLGLDCVPSDQYQLDPQDPNYGKLALFDAVSFHYTDQERRVLPSLLKQCAAIRKKYQGMLNDVKNTYPLWFSHPYDLALGFAYLKGEKGLFVIANTDYNCDRNQIINTGAIPSELTSGKRVRKIFSTHSDEVWEMEIGVTFWLYLKPGEVVVLERI